MLHARIGILSVVLASLACTASQGARAPSPATDSTHAVPGWSNRDYDLHLPPGYDPATPVPIVVVFHGGGSYKDVTPTLTCPNADLSDPACLNNLADREHFAVVYPNGTANPVFPNVRTWNAGGGSGGWGCVSGYACKQGADDIAYVRALLDAVGSVVNVDPKRVFATGISNGAAMAQRLACELSDRIAAIAPVAGENQFSTSGTCAPPEPVAVVELHGTADPYWPYDGGDGNEGLMISTADTVLGSDAAPGWARRNGCNLTPTTTALPDTADDGTTVELDQYEGCTNGAAVWLYRIVGGGHTWPGGYQYAAESKVGKTTRDIQANEVMWQFFAAHPKP
jgi:polyhydroxybutyrate depolymerase